MARNPHGFFSVFFNQSTGAYLGRPGIRTYTPMDSGFMMGGVLFARSYFNDTDSGSSNTNTIVTLAEELWRSIRFDSLLCDREGLVDPTADGVPMLQEDNASLCSATQFPQQDGYYEYTEEFYTVWYAYVQACGIDGGANSGANTDGGTDGGNGNGSIGGGQYLNTGASGVRDRQTQGCKDKAMEAMWKAWQGRRTKPIHSYGGHPLMTLWSGYMMQFPYYTIAPSNSDPAYAELFKQSWLADWAYYNNTAGSQNATAGNRGRYGLGGHAPSV
jgi:hypothetical protein